MGKMLTKDFFNRDAVVVARELIGKTLVCKRGGEVVRAIITETEVYDGERDLACHASKGRTARSETLYLPAGHLYVYLCYGMHWMLNVVVRERDYPAAVLIRGVEGVSGPGRVTKHFGISKAHNGAPASRKIGCWFEEGGDREPRNIKATPRIGVDYAGPVWSKKKWRFVVEQ